MENQKPDWKQWIPIYGLFKGAKEELRGKPTILDNPTNNLNGYVKSFGAFYYHVITAEGILIGAYKGLEQLLR